MLLAWAALLSLAHAEHYYNNEENPEEQYHYYKYTDAEPTATSVTTTEEEESTKVTGSPLRTLNHQEFADVQAALKVLMQNHEMKDLLFTTTDADAADVTDMSTPWLTVPNNVLLSILEHLDASDETDGGDIPTRSSVGSMPTRVQTSSVLTPTPSDTTPQWRTVNYRIGQDDVKVHKKTGWKTVTYRIGQDDVEIHNKTDWQSVNYRIGQDDVEFETDSMDNASESFELVDKLTGWQALNLTRTMDRRRRLGDHKDWKAMFSIVRQGPPTSSTSLDSNDTAANEKPESETNEISTTTSTTWKSRRRKTRSKMRRRRTKTPRKFTYSSSTTKSRRRKTRYRTTSTTTTRNTAVTLDVPRLLELITNLTMDYSMNLTDLMNKTLQNVSMFTCPTPPPPTTTTPPTTTVVTTTEDPYGNLTGTIMGKCFVCGIEEPAMPRDAKCADAFAGDFIPLVPVEATAKKYLASYRKYCRWMNVPKYIINETDPRSMWGRWTGGCSVRWIDISGIYTQRTCRNRHRAVMGRHWMSKRMAKLEMALQRLDNACLISPMSSLVPLSRGVSLYARFHACVCTGSWCNRAPPRACVLRHLLTAAILVLLYRE